MVLVFETGMYQLMNGVIENAKKPGQPFFIRREEKRIVFSEKAFGGVEGWEGVARIDIPNDDRARIVVNHNAQVYISDIGSMDKMTLEGNEQCTIFLENLKIDELTLRARGTSVIYFDSCDIDKIIILPYDSSTIHLEEANINKKLILKSGTGKVIFS